MPPVDILDRELPENPVSDWNVTYLPYCDGSLFVGDADHDDDGDGEMSACIAVLRTSAASMSRKRPSRTRNGCCSCELGGRLRGAVRGPLLKEVYPDAELVLSDSAVGVARQ